MAEDNKKVSWGTIFSVASVCFGIHIGGGFASGNQTVQFFVRFGWTAPLFAVIAVFGMCAVFCIGVISEQVNQAKNMGEAARGFYYPLEKVFSPLYQLLFIIVGFIATAASIAGSASLLTTYGVPYGAGVFVSGIIFLLLTVFGSDLVAKASTVMTIGIIVTLLIICYFGLTAKEATVKIGETTRVVQAGLAKNLDTSQPVAAGGLGIAIWFMLQYIGYQSQTATTISPYAMSLKTPGNAVKMAVVNFILNASMMLLCILAMSRFRDALVNEKGMPINQLPMLTVARAAGHEWVRHLYSIMVYLAFISTAVGCIFGAVTRYENSFLKQVDIRVRRGILSAAMMVIAMFMSLVGLTALVAKGYAHVGKVNVFLVIIPMFTIIAARAFKGKVTRRDLMNK